MFPFCFRYAKIGNDGFPGKEGEVMEKIDAKALEDSKSSALRIFVPEFTQETSKKAMTIEEKLNILATGAKYDVSCSSSGSRRKNGAGGMGNAAPAGICHSWSDDGRCISLLKILQGNACAYNCSYCLNRKDASCRRAVFSPAELADLTMNFYRRNYIEGLFLSSAVIGSPDATMELMLKTVKLLRQGHGFNGYIHMKAIPGADRVLIDEAATYVDRMSVNVEFANPQSLALFAPDKNSGAIYAPMDYLHQRSREQKGVRLRRPFLPAGQTSQMIVGATGESDREIINLSQNLYQSYSLKRVYYSAYAPVAEHPLLPGGPVPLWREHRLYEADWLMRFYGFGAEELLDEKQKDFSEAYDPKVGWALNHLDLFPVEVNSAPYELLLRVPGIGVLSAKKIIMTRRFSSLDFDTLARMGVVLKRAVYFITANGKYRAQSEINREVLCRRLSKPEAYARQLSIFDFIPITPQASLPSPQL